MQIIELFHLGYNVVYAPYAKLLSPHPVIPGIDAAEGAVSPAAPAGEDAGYGLAKVTVEGGAPGKGQPVQVILLIC